MESILIKAGVLHFARIVEIVQDICMLKKLPKPDALDVMAMAQKRSYVMADSQVFIAKSELCFSDRRLAALRDFLVLTLVRANEPIAISSLIEQTKSNMQELSPILANVATKVL